MIDGKKVLFSGMQATGTLTIGNFLGALKNWVTLSEEYECFYSVVDLHSITGRQDPAELRKRARALLTLYIAAGLDPKKNWQKMGIMAIEMESAALYLNAARYRKNALCVCTVSDQLIHKQYLTAEERQTGFEQMMKVALETAVKLEG